MTLTNSSMISSHGYGLLNFLALSDSEYKMLERAIEALKVKPVDASNFHQLFERQVGYSFTIPFSALYFSWENEEFSQYSVKPKLVLNLLVSPVDGLLNGNKLSRHIEVGFREDNVREDGSIIDVLGAIIAGGRHRYTALLNILILSEMLKRGIDVLNLHQDDLREIAKEIAESDEIQDLQVPVQPVLYSLQYISRSNQSRRMDGSENLLINLQVQNVGMNLTDIALAATNKVLTPAKAWQAMFALLADSGEAEITPLASKDLGGKLFRALNDHAKGKTKNAYKFPVRAENLVKLVQALWERVPSEIQQVKAKGFTNIARDGVGSIALNLAGYALTNGTSLWDAEKDVPPGVVVSPTKAKAQAKNKTTTKKKADSSKPKNGRVTVRRIEDLEAEQAAKAEEVDLVELTSAG